MPAVAESTGKWVKVKCLQCGDEFPYLRTSNVIRKFCTKCAKLRAERSRQESERTKKAGITRSPEEIEGLRRLKHIPNAVNWNKVLTELAKD